MKSGFVLEADIKTISRQIISIVTQVKRDRELKQQADAVKDSAHAAVQAAQSLPAGSGTSSSTSLPLTAATAQQSRVAGAQPPAPSAAAAAAAAVTSPTAVPPPGPAPEVENASSAQTNGLPVSSAVAPVAATLPSVVTVAGQTSTVNTVTGSVNAAATQPAQPTHAKPPSGLLNL